MLSLAKNERPQQPKESAHSYIQELVRNSFIKNIPDNGCYRNTTKFRVNQLSPQKCGY